MKAKREISRRHFVRAAASLPVGLLIGMPAAAVSGFVIYFGCAMPMSGAEEGRVRLLYGRRGRHTLRELRFFRGCTGPLLTYASAKTPGSTWPVPGQRFYEQAPVQGVSEEGSPASYAPPWRLALYHLPLSQVC